MSYQVIWGLITVASWLFILREIRQRWKRASANPARAALPWTGSVLLGSVIGSLGFIPFRCIGSGERTIVHARPGIGSVERGDMIAVKLKDGLFAHVVVGLPGDRVRVEGTQVVANDEPVHGLTWPLRRDATDCPSLTVDKAHIAAIERDHPGGCDAVRMIDGSTYAGRALLVIWPPWKVGRTWTDP